MLFNSYEFLLVFLPLTLVCFLGVRRLGYFRASLVCLVAASFTFYAYWRPDHFLVFLTTIVVNYHLGRSIAADATPRRKALTVLGVVLNLSVLVYFKYTGFLIDNLSTLFGHEELGSWNLVLPIGISFYTFQQIAYIVDCYSSGEAEEHFWEYALFVSFFPQLIAGPIVHHQTTRPQFAWLAKAPIDPKLPPMGLALLVLGLGKKVLFADNLAAYASPVFDAADAGTALSGTVAWVGALAYTLQIYFDFSGYSDIAVGLGLIFGIRIPINFNSPYKSISIIDFWRRWHITLSTWLRDYVYIPLGGNRRGEAARLRNVFLTMLIGGVWHGAGWTFIIWGALHGVFITINHLLRKTFPVPLRPSLSRTVVQRLGTLVLVIVAWVFFRATTVSGAMSILGSMSGGGTSDGGAGLFDSLVYGWLAVGGTIALLFPNSMEMVGYRFDPSGKADPSQKPGLIFALPSFVVNGFLGLVLALVLASVWRPTVFIYFNF